MRRHLLATAAVAILAGTLLAVADPPPPAADDKVARLLAQLGDPDFARREAAEKDLDALGELALDQLRAAGRSANPEVARRARAVAARVERRVENEKALAPKLVQLDVENAPLSKPLALLSEQTGYSVVLHEDSGDQATRVKVTLKTEKVPFWEAVLRLCDATNLQIASVGGFVAPGSGAPDRNPFDRSPPGTRPRPRRPIGGTAQNQNTVVLEPRGARKKRPAAVYGAVCVEAFPLSAVAAAPDTEAVVLQVWAEPNVSWQTTNGVRVTRATDNVGQALAARPDVPVQPPQVVAGNGVVIVRNVQGGVVLVNQNVAQPVPVPTAFAPNARQVVVSLKPGEKASAGLAELTGVISGTVRSATEQLVCLSDLQPGKSAEGAHPAGTEMRAVVRGKGDGKYGAEVELSYDTIAVLPANLNGVVPPPGTGGRAGDLIHGVRVTDADGKAFLPSPVEIAQRVDPTGRRVVWVIRLALEPTVKVQGPPTQVAFWGTYGKPVEVAFGLKGVPLADKKK